jgi:hypothetical protein
MNMCLRDVKIVVQSTGITMTPNDVIDFVDALVGSHRRAVLFEVCLMVCFFGLRRYITRRAAHSVDEKAKQPLTPEVGQ